MVNEIYLAADWLRPAFTSGPLAGGATHNVAVTCSQQILSVCFVKPPEGSESSIFGFAEFGTALALLVIVYTISDVRYRFRIAVAPIPLFSLTYALLGIIGIGSLISDLWFAERWPMPHFLVSQPLWQFTLGSMFLALVLIWVYYAFIRPPIFSKVNYKRFSQELFRLIFKGSEIELPVICGELARSAASIIKISKAVPNRWDRNGKKNEQSNTRNPHAADYAYELLLLIGNRKLCRHIVASAPGTAVAFFDAAATEQKYNIPLGQFASNVSTEALINKDSILYHEDEGYRSGLIGYLRPFSKAIYGNYQLVETLASNGNSPLDLEYRMVSSWDAKQFEAYSRAVAITFESYLLSGGWYQHSYSLFRAVENIENSCMDVYKLNGISLEESFDSDIYRRLNVAVKFVKNAIYLINKQKHIPKTTLRRRAAGMPTDSDFYDHIATLMFDIIFHAAAVKSPQDRCWIIQHNTVWGEFFDLSKSGKVWKIIHFKLRRLLFDEIRKLEQLPNYKGARILGFCLNVMGLTLGEKKGYGSEYYALKKAILRWTKRNFLRMKNTLPDVAESCLMGGISFDGENARLVKTFIKGLHLEAPKEFLELEDEDNTRK